MNVFFFIPTLKNAGGAERVITVLANSFAKYGHKVQIQMLRDCYPFYDVDQRIQIKWIEINRSKIRIFRWIQKPFTLKKYIKEFTKSAISFDADITVSFLFFSNIISVLSRKYTNIPTIISERNDPLVAGRRYERKISSLLYPKADLIICQGQKVACYYEALSGKCMILPNPLNSAAIGEYVAKKKKQIVSVGRLVPQKNHRILIDAFAMIYDKHRDFRLVIIGEGKEKLEKQIRSLGLENAVFIRENMKNVMSQVNDSACFVLSSDYEGMPNVLIEAMASGMPVVSTDFRTGIARELIKDGENGFVVPVGDVKRLAMAIDTIISSEELQKKMGLANLYIREKLDEEKISKQWESTLMSIANDLRK